SPAMHNAAFAELDVPAEYKLFPLEEDELDQFFTDLRKESSPIFGLNVTVPYKEKVLSYMDSLNPLAERIGAVNTIVINQKRKLLGYNTDAPGFMAHMAELEMDIKGKRVAILGAGGSARAIIATLCMIPDRPESIKIYNRTTSRLEVLLEDIGQRINIDIVEPVNSIDDLNMELADVLINTTSLGLKKDDPLLLEDELFHPHMFVYDLIYNPSETKLLAQARKKGAKTANGLGMLFYQGVLALQHWANTQLDDKVKIVMRKALYERIGC
ncbi:MAG: shikimate dehydrogenase, partial [Candidatus Omnitrophica bacterium]|nr:shikimate dehydrogenase [Candidatus Omnitrophota bacterium]